MRLDEELMLTVKWDGDPIVAAQDPKKNGRTQELN